MLNVKYVTLGTYLIGKCMVKNWSGQLLLLLNFSQMTHVFTYSIQMVHYYAFDTVDHHNFRKKICNDIIQNEAV